MYCDTYHFGMLSVTKIRQERTNQHRTKISPFLDFLLHFSIFLLGIFNIASIHEKDLL